MHLLLQQLKLTEGSPGSAPAARLPPPLPDLGLYQPSQHQHGQLGHRKAPLPLKHSSGPPPGTVFAEAGSRHLHLHGEPQISSSLVQPGSPRSQFLSWHRHSPHFLVNATRKLPPSEAGNYPGSILGCQQHILGAGWEEGGYVCQFMATGTCPACIYQALRPGHLLGWHLHGRHPCTDTGL